MLYSEAELIEQPAVQCLSDLGWDSANCYYETLGTTSTLGRETPSEVVLVSRLRPTLERLNTTLSPQAINLAIESKGTT